MPNAGATSYFGTGPSATACAHRAGTRRKPCRGFTLEGGRPRTSAAFPAFLAGLTRVRARAMARPTKLTPAVREKIVQAVAACSSYRAAALYAGVADSTLRSWLARGRAEQGATKRVRGEAPYVELVASLERAAAIAEVRAAGQIAKAGETDWRAMAWFLERRDPETFGPPAARLEHTGPDGSPIALDALGIDLDGLTDRDLASLQRILARAAHS
jgi:transposase-like protein